MTLSLGLLAAAAALGHECTVRALQSSRGRLLSHGAPVPVSIVADGKQVFSVIVNGRVCHRHGGRTAARLPGRLDVVDEPFVEVEQPTQMGRDEQEILRPVRVLGRRALALVEASS